MFCREEKIILDGTGCLQPIGSLAEDVVMLSMVCGTGAGAVVAATGMVTIYCMYDNVLR